MSTRADRLVELARKELQELFGPGFQLSPAEEKMLRAAAEGQEADCRAGADDDTDPANAEKWSRERTIRAGVLRWLCVTPAAHLLVDPVGVQVQFARIDGRLDLSFATIPFALALVACAIPEGLSIREAKTRAVNLRGSQVGSTGPQGKPGTAILEADGASIDGPLLLRNRFRAIGEVRLGGAKIGGQLSCRGGTFESRTEKGEGKALNADGAEIGGAAFLDDGFRASGEVRLLGAKIGGQLNCGGGTFENRMEDGKGAALKADGAEIGGSAFLDELFRASGEVRLVGAKISGELNCGGGTFENRTEKGEGSALSADGAEIGGSAFLRQGFRAAGEVRLLGAKISGDLSCRGGTFENRTEDGQGSALTADGATIHGGLFLDNGFRSEGQVRLTHAKAGILQDDQDCWPGAGCLVIDGFQYERIAGGSPTDAKTRIEWLRVQYPAPPAGGSYLGVWQRRRPFFVRSRKEGLFWPQPYEELAAVLLASGKPAEARKIHIAKEIDRNRYGQMGWGGRLFRRLVFGATIGYGYSLRRLFWCGVAMVAIGTAFFWWAGQAGQMQAPGVTDPPDFCPPVYSLDSLLPVVDLYQERYWRPHPGGLPGCIAGVYLWFHVSLGWMLATLGVVGITGLAKKELPRK